MGGGALLQDAGSGSKDLRQLSAPCSLGECDVFWSHSWSDSGEQKLQRGPPTVLLFGSDGTEKARVRITWLAFDVRACSCYDAEDKRRILQVSDQSPGHD